MVGLKWALLYTCIYLESLPSPVAVNKKFLYLAAIQKLHHGFTFFSFEDFRAARTLVSGNVHVFLERLETCLFMCFFVQKVVLQIVLQIVHSS